MLYHVTYQETTVIRRDIEADSEREAETKFEEMATNCEIDFTNADVIDSGLYITRG